MQLMQVKVCKVYEKDLSFIYFIEPILEEWEIKLKT